MYLSTTESMFSDTYVLDKLVTVKCQESSKQVGTLKKNFVLGAKEV